MLSPFIPILVVALFWAFIDSSYSSSQARFRRRLKWIAEYPFPASLRKKLLERYPHLDANGADQVFQGLRLYFSLVLEYGHGIAMPSRAVDSVWHDFLLFSKDYQKFCQKAFGSFLHHVPFENLGSTQSIRKSLEQAWLGSCRNEGIDPVFPDRLPLLFTLDSSLEIPDGFMHSLANDYYPLTDEGIAPTSLCRMIGEKLGIMESGQQRAETVAVLAGPIWICLFDDWYCKHNDEKALEDLFLAINEHDDLLVAVFGDNSMAQARWNEVRQQMRAFWNAAQQQKKRENSDGGGCGCGGGGCGGCGGGC